MRTLILTSLFMLFVLFANANNDSIYTNTKNCISINYAPSFTIGNSLKNVFHGVELSYEREIIKRFTISITQGFYLTNKQNTTWVETKNGQLNYFDAFRRKYYLNTEISFNGVAYLNKYYKLKFGGGPTLAYRNTIDIKSKNSAYDYQQQFYDKGVFGGVHFNIQNDITLINHLYLGAIVQTTIVFPRKNVGDKQIIIRPRFSIGYKF